MAKTFMLSVANWYVTYLFEQWGWEHVFNVDEAEYLIYPGGVDINPKFYGQMETSSVYTTPASTLRDEREMRLYYDNADTHKHIGICRGAQLLNIACGGSMWQDVDNHQGCRHWVLDLELQDYFLCNSRHHQAMIPSDKAEVLAVAKTSTDGTKDDCVVSFEKTWADVWCDIEAIAYPEQKVFCFQGHPEDCDVTEAYFKGLLQRKGFI